MFAILAAVLAFSSATPAPAARPLAPVAAQPASGAEITTTSPLPGAPRHVRVKTTSAGTLLTWRRPASTGATPITGYVVIVGEQPAYVDAGTHRLAVPAGASHLAVAAMNTVGCSLAAEATIPAPPVVPLHAMVASK